MHLGTGFYFTGGRGMKHDNSRRRLFGAEVEEEDRFSYFQGGIAKDFIGLGVTTVFADHLDLEIGAGLANSGYVLNTKPLGAQARMAGAATQAWGAAINQNIASAAMDLYIYYRRENPDVFTSKTGIRGGAVATPIESFEFVTAGARIQF